MASRKGKFRLDFSYLHLSKPKFSIKNEIYTYVSHLFFEGFVKLLLSVTIHGQLRVQTRQFKRETLLTISSAPVHSTKKCSMYEMWRKIISIDQLTSLVCSTLNKSLGAILNIPAIVIQKPYNRSGPFTNLAELLTQRICVPNFI